MTRQVYYSTYTTINIEPCVIFHSKNKPLATDIIALDSYIWDRTPRMTSHPSWSRFTRFYSLGLFHLPQNGRQAVLTLTACQGYGFAGSHKTVFYQAPQNYQCKIYIYSGNANGNIPAAGIWANSIALDVGSNTSGRVDRGCFHHAFYEVIGVWAKTE